MVSALWLRQDVNIGSGGRSLLAGFALLLAGRTRTAAYIEAMSISGEVRVTDIRGRSFGDVFSTINYDTSS